MSHWQGNGLAPGYSHAVEKANEAVRAAEASLLSALKDSYPCGSAVRVIHWRGQFEATVTGHDTHGVRVRVRNNITGKTSKWWAAHVEAIADESNAA